MKKSPRKESTPIMTKSEVFTSVLEGLLLFIGFFGSYVYLIENSVSTQVASTFSFATLVLSNIFLVYVLESDKSALLNFIDSFKDKIILLINTVILVALILIIYVPVLNNLVGTVPLPQNYLVLVLVVSLLSTVPFDLRKLFKRK
jgi:magnesium-transporting ATPase (P-type)